MANPEITNNDTLQLQVFNPEYQDATLSFTGVATWAKGVLMSRVAVSAGAVAADVGNTGNGTVTALALAPGGPPLAGAWNLECTAGYTAPASVAGVGNTGDGTVTALSLSKGGPILAGAWNLECTAAYTAPVAVADVGNTGDGTLTALSLSKGGPILAGAWNLECTEAYVAPTAGVVTAGGGNTGDGTASAATVGSEGINGTYTLTCVNDAVAGYAVSGSEVFQVEDPNGDRLEDLTVGVAYLNNHIGLTISDGATDFQLGDTWTIAVTAGTVPEHGGVFKLEDPNSVEIYNDIALPGGAGGAKLIELDGLRMTLTDGAADFIVGDKFAITVAAGAVPEHGGVFKLEDPNSVTVKADIALPGDAGGTTVVELDGLRFTLTDGATDFIVGDTFAITIAAGSVTQHGAVFKLEDPNSVLIKNDIELPGTAGGAVVVIVDGLKFTITDGATDFATGDKFSLTITDEGLDWRPYVQGALDGTGVASGVMPASKTSTGSGDVYWRMLVGGQVAEAELSVQAGGSIPAQALEDLRNFSILKISGVRTDILDNQ